MNHCFGYFQSSSLGINLAFRVEERRHWTLPGSVISWFTLSNFATSLCHAAVFSAAQAKLWGLVRAIIWFLFTSCIVANKQRNCTLPCHSLAWTSSFTLPLHVSYVKPKNNFGFTPCKLTQKYNAFQLEICLDPITEPKHNTCFVLPFTVTLCSPVPGWVYRSICMDTSPTGSSTPEPVEENWHPPCMHRLLLIGIHLCHVASADNSIFTGHLPQLAFQSALII